MKKQVLKYLFLSTLAIVWGIGAFSFAQEEDSFWEEEFFQEAPVTRLEMAEELSVNKKWEESIAEYQKIIEAPVDKDEYEKALLGLAIAYDKSGNIDQAVRYYRIVTRKAKNEDLIKKANQNLVYYEQFIIDQFHIGDWYPKLWFHNKINHLAQKHPQYSQLIKQGSYPTILVVYKFILVSLLIGLAVLFSRKKVMSSSNLIDVGWGYKSIFLIYMLFLLIQLYLGYMLKPSSGTSAAGGVTFDVVSILGYFILTACVLLYLTCRGIQWRKLGISLEQFGHHLVVSLKYFVIIIILFGIFAFLRFNGFIEQDKVIRSYPLSSVGTALYFFQFILVVIIAPISEEIFYRGFIYPVIRNKTGILVGIVLTSLFFALVHVQSFLLLFTLSFFLCFIYEKNRTLIPVILIHAFYNFLVQFGGNFLPGR